MIPLTRESEKPVVAILTYRDSTRVFRGNKDNFADLLRTAGEEGITAYIVSQEDLVLSADTIQGYTLQGGRKWRRQGFPFPNVVYNRIPYRKFEQLPEVQRLIQECLVHPKIHLFNPSFFSKWSLFEWLSKSRRTRSLIPETERLTGSATLAKLLKKHRNVYLKPVKGKAGKGIMKIQRLSAKPGSKAGDYRLTYYEKGSSTGSTQYSEISKLYGAVLEHVDGNEYIAQQGIDLATVGGRAFDLRALVQKNSNGEWKVSGVGARVAGESSITTHVPRGGSIDDPAKLLTSAFGASVGNRILKDAKKTVIELASQIESGSGHNLGEMSMDLGIDTAGKLWFFEANSKPMKFDEPHIRKMSLRRLVRYWKYLVQQPNYHSSIHFLRLKQAYSRTQPTGKGRNKS